MHQAILQVIHPLLFLQHPRAKIPGINIKKIFQQMFGQK
jgi:hypothetical protein